MLLSNCTALQIDRYELDSLRWFSQRRSCRQVLCARCVRCDVSSARMALFTFCVWRGDSAKRHIFGGCAPLRGSMTAKFELGRDFCTMHLPLSFVILCLFVRKLSCVNTITHKPTNKQIPAKNLKFLATLRRWVISEVSKFLLALAFAWVYEL